MRRDSEYANSAQAQRSSEATLAPSFAPLSLKKFELEFSVDPLFKKASADFDEGGAKGLLLNHLAIDAQGRIVFDSSDDAEAVTPDNEVSRRKRDSTGEDLDASTENAEKHDKTTDVLDDQDMEIDLPTLGSKFFPDLSKLDAQDICPSLKNLDLGDSAGLLDIPFLKVPEEVPEESKDTTLAHLGDKSGIFLDDDNAAGFDDDNEPLDGFEIPQDTGFGEGGEAWARDAALEPQLRVHKAGFEEGAVDSNEMAQSTEAGGFGPTDSQYVVSLRHGKGSGGHEDILKYFDNALQKTWAGPEHWRIRRIKDTTKPSAPAPAKRKEKEPFQIDFSSPLDPALAELIYTPASSNAAISLPKTQWTSKTRHLLPDDKHFNSRQLIRLFLKPKAHIGTRRGKPSAHNATKKEPEAFPEGEMDEAYWARQALRPLHSAEPQDKDPSDPHGDYDANFFQDDALAFPSGGGPPDDDDDDAFADAREAFSPGAEGGPGTAETAAGLQGLDNALLLPTTSQDGGAGAFGSQLVTQSRRLRPEYVQYARVAKKVDVRRLKEEMWRGLGFDIQKSLPTPPPSSSLSAPEQEPEKEPEKEPLKFTTLISNLQTVYPKRAMDDISTSYCFICLLHLANEKGLAIEDEGGLEELRIRMDPMGEVTDA